MKKALFAFNGDPMCFVHVLLNTLDMHKLGWDVKLIIEGSATALIKNLDTEDSPSGKMYREIKEKGLISCVCRACANKMGVLEEVKKQDLPYGDDMKGHPSFSSYINEGYEIMTF